jgi:Molybdopterin converting factor, small subunit
MIHVLFFGPVADHAGVHRVEVPFRTGMRWQDVRDELRQRYEQAFERVCIAAVNGERVSDEEGESLADGDEIVFMSRFSGG